MIKSLVHLTCKRAKPLLLAVLTLLVSSTNTSYGLGRSTPQDSPTLKIIVNDWTSQIILSHIAGLIFEEMGLNVAYEVMGTDSQWREISENKAHIQVEVWEGTMKDQYTKLLNSNLIVDAGTYKAITREEWWYPSYVEKLCPKLPHWEALKECYHIFATPFSEPDGLYINGPWEKPDKERIEALGLNFKILQLKNSDELHESLHKAYEQRRPILIFNWTPNFIESVYDGNFVDFPDFDPECETNPEWGINKEKIHDCGNPKSGWLKKIVATDVPEKWPCAFKTLQNFSFTNTQISDLTKEMDLSQIPVKRVALKWHAKNKHIWKEWIPQECQSQVQ